MKIRVTLTVEQWNALVSCARGELEGLTEADWESGNFDALDSAMKAMHDGRAKTAAKREP